MKNRVNEVRSAIRTIWPLQLPINELVHCHGETALLSSPNETFSTIQLIISKAA